MCVSLYSAFVSAGLPVAFPSERNSTEYVERSATGLPVCQLLDEKCTNLETGVFEGSV